MMTDKERYKQAFGALRASDELSARIMDKINNTEAVKMSKEKKASGASKRIIAVIAAAVVLVVGCGSAYAANVGGVQRAVQLWIRGDQTDAVLTIDTPDPNGANSYTITYTDEDGNEVEQQGGGIAYDFWGNERPLTEEEIMEHLSEPEVEFNEDGTVFVYCRDQKIDVTDKFDEDGFCYVTVDGGNRKYYLTIQRTGEGSGGYCMNDHRYPQPWEFSVG